MFEIEGSRDRESPLYLDKKNDFNDRISRKQ